MRTTQICDSLLDKCDKYGVSWSFKKAGTGTIYLKLIGVKNDEIVEKTVRIAKHHDAYCTADFNIGPDFDQRKAVRKWIIDHKDVDSVA